MTEQLTRTATRRRYLMCAPEHFEVSYAINPWMSLDVPADAALALRQWEDLRRTYLELGHEVELIEPVRGLPDMVFAANGGLVVGGVAYGARFTYPERTAEGPAYEARFRELGLDVRTPVQTNEGEGDLLTVGDVILAGTGFRTSRSAHAEIAGVFGREVVTLELVDPRFYHLDTALSVLDERTIAYYPGAFTEASRETLRRRFPDAILVAETDAAVLGLNAVSDGYNVVLSKHAAQYAEDLRARGYNPIGVDLSELLKAGGGAKCCTLELRS